MSYDKQKIGDKNFIAYAPKDETCISATDILSSWETNSFGFPEGKSQAEVGFRSAQLGAIFSIKSHWTVSSSAATVVMPTGTGKTEVMIATVVSECCKKTCVVVPSDLLRTQTLARFCTLEKLRDIGAITDLFKSPTVGCLVASPKDRVELEELIEKSNVIVVTMSLLNSNRFNDEFLKLLAYECDTLIIDEAHHIPANSWKSIKKYFDGIRCLQFTATPFRNDGKKIDGDIIYNFPLSLAQERGYFKPINFYPVMEFDEDKKDITVAAKAVELLEADIEKGYPHLLLVRASTQIRARDLHENVYCKYYGSHNPVLIISGNTGGINKAAHQRVVDGSSKIIVCVDMFSEGIDIPQLKICAVHDKYKSLPITMQFIGRFARNQANLGEASVVANIVDDNIQESLEELYSQDADWNEVLKDVSDEKVGREVELQKLARGFTGTETIPLNQIKPKVSMFMYITADTSWHWRNWIKVFNEDHSSHCINEQENILIITERSTTNVDWTSCRDVVNDNWNLHILYWNKKQKIFFINSTDKGMADRLAQAVFDSFTRITGEQVFRCLHGVKRLMLATVGLKTAVSSHHIRYRMFAGSDVAHGLTEATKNTAIKSNLFGVGFEGGDNISIGCSYKGTIWAKWVETIDYWKNWCDKQSAKILDASIDTNVVLSGVLVPEAITTRPSVVPYRIDFPLEIDAELRGSTYVKTSLHDTRPYLVDIGLTTFDETSPLSFFVGNKDFKEEFVLNIIEGDYTVSHKSGSSITMSFGRGREVLLKDFFKENPPIIWFVDGSSIEGNLLVKLKESTPTMFPHENIKAWNWNDVNIQKESQGASKLTDSIQYKLISELKMLNQYCLIFDDDGAGEVADVVAIQEDSVTRKLVVELYHCKFSGGSQAGARVDDLYTVCGQAEKCIKWVSDPTLFLDRLAKRESDRIQNHSVSRYELGGSKHLFMLKNKLKAYSVEFRVYIVQPGVDSTQVTPAMHRILCSASAYLMDTYGIPLVLICS